MNKPDTSRIFAAAAAIAVVLSLSASFAFAMSFSDVNDGMSCSEAVEALSEEGIILGYEDGSFRPENNITRAEFAAVIVRAAKGEPEASDEKSAFSDVAEDSVFKSYINTAHKAGIISGYDGVHFAPDDNVTYEQAVKMVVCAAGLEADEAKNGGYPDVYISIAEDNGITANVNIKNGSVPATRGDTAMLVYNARMIHGGAESEEYIPADIEPLPNQKAFSNIEDIKQGVLAWCAGTEKAYRDAGMTAQADALKADAEKITQTDFRINPVPANYFPEIKNFSENKIAGQAIKKVESLMNQKLDYTAGREGGLTIIKKYNDINTRAEEAALMLWAFMYPESPMAHDPDLLIEILKRTEIITYMMQDGSYYPEVFTNVDNHYNIFSAQQEAWNVIMLSSVLPDAIPDSLLERVKTFTREAMYYQINDKERGKVHGEPAGSIPNIDSEFALMSEAAARLLEDGSYRKYVDQSLEALDDRMQDDGAWPYMYNENECFSYHSAILRDLAKFEFITRDGTAKKIIEKSINFYPLAMEANGSAEYASAPSWKTMWNASGSMLGPMVVAYFTGDPVHQWYIENQLAITNGALQNVNTSEYSLAAALYRTDITPKPADDNYIKYDGNIQGVRGRFGNFSYMMDVRGRIMNPGEPVFPQHEYLIGSHMGKATVVSAMILSDSKDAIAMKDSILFKAYASSYKKPEEPFWIGAVYLSNMEDNTFQYGDGFGSMSVRHDLGAAGYGPSFKADTSCQSKEAWIALDNRLVGFVSIEALEDHKTAALAGHVPVGPGRTGKLEPKTMELKDKDTYVYGKMNIRVVSQNYGRVEIRREQPVYREESKNCDEIYFSDANAPGNNTLYDVKKGTEKYFVIDVYPEDAKPSKQSAYEEKDGIVTITAGDYSLVFNNTNTEKSVKLIGNVYVPDDDYAEKTIPVNGGDIKIPAYGHVVVKK